MARVVRIFVSSPGDVGHERQRIDRVVARLNGEFAGVVRLETIRWETEFYRAHATFQEQIPASADCEIVVAIFRARLGTELPPEFERLPDGSPYPSGTAYEVLTAIAARQSGTLPDVYVFRFPEPPTVRLDDPEAAQVQSQWQRLKAFFDRWFVAAEGPFKAAFHTYRSVDDLEEQLDRLLRGWLEDNVLHGRAVAWPIALKGSPFRGLAAFGAKHAPVFFGRSRDIARAVDRWKDAAERRSAFLLVVGASGSGKSSLARAGLLPRLTAPGVVPEVDLWRTAVLRPSEAADGPMMSLATRLLDGEPDIPQSEAGRPPAIPELADSDYRTPAELAALLNHADAGSLAPLLRALDRIGEEVRARQGYERPVRIDLVVLIDQLDELFAADIVAEERTRFATLLRLMAESGRIWVVTTLRADLYERFLAEPVLLALKGAGAAYDLAAPGPAELAEIVRKPAEAAELHFDRDAATGEALDERLLRDADRADMLPLLQLALNRLFEERITAGSETRLSLVAYQALGGLAGIIDREAEGAVADLGETEQGRLPRLLRRLATATPGSAAGAGAGLTVRTVPLAEAAPDEPSRRLVEKLIEARILLATGEGSEAGIHLAHQRVLSDWQRARDLIAANQDFYRIREEIEAQRRRWHAAGDRTDLLIPRGLPLAEAESIAGRFGDELIPETRAFIAASSRRAHLRQRLTTAAAAVFALLAVVATGAGIFAFNERRHALEQQVLAETEKSRAERNLTAAKQAVHGLIFDIAQGMRSQAGIGASTIQKVLDRVQATIDRLSHEAPDDVELSVDRATMFDEFARTFLAAGDLADAGKAAETALTTMRALAAAHPDDQHRQDDIAVILNRSADIKLRSGDTAGALAQYDEAAAIVHKLVAAAPDDPRYQRDLALSLANTGDIKLRQGNSAGSLAAYQQALTIHRGLAARDPSATEPQRDVAVMLNRVADVQVQAGDGNAALAAYREALAIDRKLAAQDSGNVEWQHDVAVDLQRIGDVQQHSGDGAGALASHREEVDIMRRLAGLDPSNTDWQRELAVGVEHQADLASQAGDVAAALAGYREELAIVRRLAQRDPANTQWQQDLALALERSGDLEWRRGDQDAAAAEQREALALRRKLAERDPQNADVQHAVAISLERIGDIESERGTPAAAEAAYDEELAINRRVAEQDPGNLDMRQNVAISLERRGLVKLRAGDTTAALATFGEEVDLFRDIVKRAPDDLNYQRGLATALEKQSSAWRRSEDKAKAQAADDEVLAIRRKLAARDPGNSDWQNDLAIALTTIGDTKRQQQDTKGAAAAHQEALAIRRKLAAQDPDDATRQHSLAVSLERLGDLDIQVSDDAGAAAFYSEELAVVRKIAARDPGNRGWQHDLAAALERAGLGHTLSRDLAAALAENREALAIHRALAADDPGNADYQQELGRSLHRVGTLQQRSGDKTAARASFADAATVGRDLLQRRPDDIEQQRALATTLGMLADAAADDHAAALAALTEQAELLRKITGADKADKTSRTTLAGTLDKMGDLQRQTGDNKAASATYQEATTAYRALAQDTPGEAAAQRSLAVALNKTGDVQLVQGDTAAALDRFREALTLVRAIAHDDPRNALWQRDVSVTLTRIGQATQRSGDTAAAIAAYREALDLRQHIADADPTNSAAQQEAATVASALGDAELAAKDKDAALTAYRNGLTRVRKLAERDPGRVDWQISEILMLGRIAGVTSPADRITALNEALQIAEHLAAEGKLKGDQLTWPDQLRKLLAAKD